jgi:hypothetical protein
LSPNDPPASTAQQIEKYLELVKRAVLDDLQFEHELRIEYLLDVVERGADVDPERLRDPIRQMRVRADELRAERRSGRFRGADRMAPHLALTVGRTRLDALHRALDDLRRDAVWGDLVVVGAGRGGTAIFLQAYLDSWDMTDRTLWVVDTFHPPPSGAADLNAVRDAFGRFDLLGPNVRFVQGEAGALDDQPATIAVLQIGLPAADQPRVLEALEARVADGGLVACDDAPAGSSELRRTTTARAAPSDTAAPRRSTCDLSVIVVFYNMQREARRTLHSLSRAYQLDIDQLDYEVVVVENGSAPDQRLGEAFVRSFGPEFRYIDMGDAATSSPVGALNAGIDEAKGEHLTLMIDGAHVLTPRVLHFGMLGLGTYAPAVVATQQWYVGPGQQPQAVQAGYDQATEDLLFDEIDWPGNGYRLFDIGQFIGERDWFDGMWESNCLFVPRHLLEQSGAFDHAFSMAGGGYANLELYERLVSTPGVTSVTILGEGSFHQVHGGTTTNEPEVGERHAELASYEEHFRDVRGQSYRGHGKPTHYVGTMRQNTMRSRARRLTSAHFARPKQREGDDGLPQRPTPMPDDLKNEFIEAFWDSMAWRQSSWLGWKTGKAPTDLFVYQELISRLRPSWIVETGAGPGGRS